MRGTRTKKLKSEWLRGHRPGTFREAKAEWKRPAPASGELAEKGVPFNRTRRFR